MLTAELCLHSPALIQIFVHRAAHDYVGANVDC